MCAPSTNRQARVTLCTDVCKSFYFGISVTEISFSLFVWSQMQCMADVSQKLVLLGCSEGKHALCSACYEKLDNKQKLSSCFWCSLMEESSRFSQSDAAILYMSSRLSPSCA